MYDNVLCSGCCASQVMRPEAFCVLCTAPSPDWRLCPACHQSSGLTYAWVGTEYDGLVKQIIHKYKFERARAAYADLAKILDASLPYGDWQLAPIPTAVNHIRQRGYDQAQLLAAELASLRALPLIYPLSHVTKSRQVGANRAERAVQSEKAFRLAPNVQVKGLTIVLVDDVCTTGSTLSAAAQLLRRAGAKEVNAVVCAWQAPSHEKTTA